MSDETAEINEPSAEPKTSGVEVKVADMPEEMQEFAISLIVDALGKYELESDVAGHIKKQMDVSYGLLWHCIVGTRFGSYVTHLQGSFLYVSVSPEHHKPLATTPARQNAGDYFALLFKTN